ncbi:uncharacterized protein [Dysidea avara]|uniref:uncharacterized protein n=1 Tax=Dysidea avara TaxID=196820 RepID=UPI003328D15A
MPIITIDKNDFDTEVLTGYLVKSPPLTKRGMCRWQKRYFVLRANRFLEYYKSPSQANSIPKGVIDLRECIRMEVGLQFRKMRHILSVQTYQRLYYFNAPNDLSMRQWADLVYKVKEAMEGDTVDVSLHPSLITPQIVTGTVEDDGSRTRGDLASTSHDQLEQTFRSELIRSRQYSRLQLKRQEKPLDRRFLKKSIRYTGFYKQQDDKTKDSSESDQEDTKLTAEETEPQAAPQPQVNSSKDVMGLLQSVESLSNFFDIKSDSLSHDVTPSSCDLASCDQSSSSEVSSGYESMDSPTQPPPLSQENSTSNDVTSTNKDAPTVPARLKARKRTKPIPRPRQHRAAAPITTPKQDEELKLIPGQTVSTTFNPQLLATCAAGIGCFGNDGGILSADNSSVTVDIPKGAIPLDAHPYMMQFEVCTEYRPPIPPTHLISPLIHVSSSNETFIEPIKLSIPHHMPDINPANCVVLATKQDLTTQRSVTFTSFPVTMDPIQNDISCYLDNGQVTVSTKTLEYYWFVLAHVGSAREAITRQCRMLVFHSRPKHGTFHIKLCVTEDYSDAIQAAVQAQTSDNKFSLDRDNIIYQLKDWEGTCYLSISEMEFGYSLIEGVSTKAVSLYGSRCWATVEFVVKEMFNSPSKLFTCDVVMDTNHQAHVITELEIQPYIM